MMRDGAATLGVQAPLRSRPKLMMGLLLGLALLGLCGFTSILYGAADLNLTTIYQAVFAFDGSVNHLIVRTIRLPRTLIALSVGACLGVAGAVMQALTRNPLADPQILGINAGAALVLVTTIVFFPATPFSLYPGLAFVGGGIAAVTVMVLGTVGGHGLNPIRLTIAGAAITALLASLTTGLLILNQRALDEIRFWLSGSVAGREFPLLLQVLPYMGVGLGVAFSFSHALTTLNLGDDVAKGLGQRTAWVKVSAALSVVVLAGSCVAIAGPIGFVGLVVPHVVRFFVGVDYRWILPYAFVLGGILLLLADISARLIIKPQELPVGIMMALVGAPFFIYLARWQGKRG
ncbi:MAG: iron ABC transporter permease [Leptolyngbyaceae bacterium]|nr:iron ABC transporter permease [Leptolyngbyaceae bacterium]